MKNNVGTKKKAWIIYSLGKEEKITADKKLLEDGEKIFKMKVKITKFPESLKLFIPPTDHSIIIALEKKILERVV